jgi:AraC-like DNA-binding protein
MSTFKITPGIQTGLKALDVDPAAVLRRAGLPLTLFSSGEGMVTTEQFFALWRALDEVAQDPGIGLKLVGRVPVEQHHPVSIAAHHARTFRDALQRMARYKILCCSEEMRLVEGKGECSVEYNWILARELTPPLLIDAVFASSMEMGRRGTGQPLHPLRIELKRPEKHRALLENHFVCAVKFKARRDAIIYRSSDLDRPFLTYNAGLLALLSPELDRELARQKSGQTIASRVKWVLIRLLGGHRPEIAEVARELGMSGRTLQRRITGESTSFRQLVSDARRELAKQYLLQPSLQLNETACLLGYEDPNSFFRAFREWEGTTPGEWRNLQQKQSGRLAR